MAEFFRLPDLPDSTVHSVDGLDLPLDSKYYRAIWISDFHLGTARCKAEALLDFLRGHVAETLYLVGDVIDGRNIGPGWSWNAAQTAVVEEIWAWRRRGTRIVFLSGNHDERNIDMVRTLFGPIECVGEIVHRTEEGRRMLVIHGHQFDGSMHLARWISRMGSVSYSTALRVNLWYNRERLQPANGSRIAKAYLRRRLKSAVHYLTDFEDVRVLETAARRKVDG